MISTFHPQRINLHKCHNHLDSRNIIKTEISTIPFIALAEVNRREAPALSSLKYCKCMRIIWASYVNLFVYSCIGIKSQICQILFMHWLRFSGTVAICSSRPKVILQNYFIWDSWLYTNYGDEMHEKKIQTLYTQSLNCTSWIWFNKLFLGSEKYLTFNFKPD